MKINKVVVGSYQTNCYLLEIDNNVLIVDPGDEFDKIKEQIGDKNVIGILLTHRHFDHIGALESCVKEYQVPVYEYKNLEEKEYQLDNFVFEVKFMPGHTNDSVIYYFKNDNSLFTGDFLFKESIGRTDLGGNDLDMKKSINKIIEFASEYPNTDVYPGHGPKTNLTYEINMNFYLKSVS